MIQWIEDNFTDKGDKCVYKFKNKKGEFIESIIIPTAKWPLLSNDYEIFHQENTKAVTDKQILKIVDEVPYEIGRCYVNTRNVYQRLTEHGHHVDMYVGWQLSPFEMPKHHSWCVLDGVSLIDLSDDLAVLFHPDNMKHFEKCKTIDEYRSVMDGFMAFEQRLKNSERCYPLGQPYTGYLYVGTKCEDLNQGLEMYEKLIKQYPDHPSRNVNYQQGFDK